MEPRFRIKPDHERKIRLRTSDVLGYRSEPDPPAFDLQADFYRIAREVIVGALDADEVSVETLGHLHILGLLHDLSEELHSTIVEEFNDACEWLSTTPADAAEPLRIVAALWPVAALGVAVDPLQKRFSQEMERFIHRINEFAPPSTQRPAHRQERPPSWRLYFGWCRKLAMGMPAARPSVVVADADWESIVEEAHSLRRRRDWEAVAQLTGDAVLLFPGERWRFQAVMDSETLGECSSLVRTGARQSDKLPESTALAFHLTTLTAQEAVILPDGRFRWAPALAPVVGRIPLPPRLLL